MSTNKVPTMAEMAGQGESPEVLFWVGCAGSFDDRYKAVTEAFAKILNKDARQFHFVSKVWRVSDGGGVRVRGQLRQQSGHRGRGGREGGRGQCLITPYLSLQYILQ